MVYLAAHMSMLWRLGNETFSVLSCIFHTNNLKTLYLPYMSYTPHVIDSTEGLCHELSATSCTCIRYLTYFAVVIDGRRELAKGIGGGASLGGAGSFLPCTSMVSVPS